MKDTEDNLPIKSNERSQELGRDHHFILLFCWKIRRGLKKEIEPGRLKQYLGYFWTEHLKSHFLDEEVLLFNRFDNELCDRAKKGHQQIVNQIDMILGGNNRGIDVYSELIEMLRAYIRFEEETVFPYLEKALSQAALHSIGYFLDKEHPNPFQEVYADQFWLDKTT